MNNGACLEGCSLSDGALIDQIHGHKQKTAMCDGVFVTHAGGVCFLAFLEALYIIYLKMICGVWSGYMSKKS